MKAGPKRVQIEIREREAYGRNWVPKLKWVENASVTTRALPSSLFHEPMEIEHQGFRVACLKHSGITSSTVFRDGVFYGTVDGYEVGGPCSSREQAVSSAFHSLISGGYETALISSIECYEGWPNHCVDENLLTRAERELPLLKERLLKAQKAGLVKQRHPGEALNG